ncbi:MAG: hypothetical protein ACYTHN_19475, partial [Planctomycetota bacterium]
MGRIIECGQCNSSLEVPDGSAGSKFRCPGCQFIFVVPKPPESPAPDGEKDREPGFARRKGTTTRRRQGTRVHRKQTRRVKDTTQRRVRGENGGEGKEIPPSKKGIPRPLLL